MGRHLSYANVMATLAVFLALGGGLAWALARDSVGRKQIRKGAVRGPEVANGKLRGNKELRRNSVGGSRIKESSLGKVRNADRLDGKDSTAYGAGAVMGTIAGVNTESGNRWASPSGTTEGTKGSRDPVTVASPAQDIVARDLAVNISAGPGAASDIRTFTLQVNGESTALQCQILGGDQTCTSNDTVSVPAESNLVLLSNVSCPGIGCAVSPADAQFGWRATMPSD